VLGADERRQLEEARKRLVVPDLAVGGEDGAQLEGQCALHALEVEEARKRLVVPDLAVGGEDGAQLEGQCALHALEDPSVEGGLAAGVEPLHRAALNHHGNRPAPLDRLNGAAVVRNGIGAVSSEGPRVEGSSFAQRRARRVEHRFALGLGEEIAEARVHVDRHAQPRLPGARHVPL
jgi:hypothetical protein